MCKVQQAKKEKEKIKKANKKYLHRKALKCVKFKQAFPTEEKQDRSFLCGKVATLWLTRSSHNSHNTLTSPKLTLHPTKSFWIQRGVMLARQANKTAHMPLVRFPNPHATGSWGNWLTCHLPQHHLKKYKLKFLPGQCSGLIKWVLENCQPGKC